MGERLADLRACQTVLETQFEMESQSGLDNEAVFIAERDSFYMASVSETGWPYVQYRGGPKGFLKQLDDRTLAFADYRGNRQYLTLGNVTADDRVSLILMDYAGRARLKIFAHAKVVPLDADPDLVKRLVTPGYKAHPKRIMMLHLEAFDWPLPAVGAPTPPGWPPAR
jgi:predicted pyridoxine 5'-phosphate oxidase superfamily flavin-nucleotide-binding protein